MNTDQGIFAYLSDWLDAPDKVLIEYYKRAFTQAEFREIVLKTAGFLNKNGFVGSVAIMLPNIPEALFAIYGASASGLAANLINPRLPANTLRRILSKTGSKIIFLYDKLLPRHAEVLKELDVKPVLCSPLYYRRSLKALYLLTKRSATEDYFETIYEYAPITPVAVDGSSAAAYIHSGGTTGEPKTVVISAKALNELERAVVTSVHPDPSTIPDDGGMLMMLPVFHGFGLGISAHTIACHIRMVLEPVFKAKEAAKLIRRHRITHMAGVPSMYRKLAEEPAFKGKGLSKVMRVFCGGDILSPEIKRKFDAILHRYGSDAEILEGYGLTETASVVTVNPVGAVKERSQGKPLNGNRIKITADGTELPPMTAGEIEVAPVSLMSGYFNDPAATANAVYTDSEGVKWLKTGDMGYVDSDGYLYFSERIKRSLKIAAINVFPSEIEAVSATVPGVSGACAARMKDSNGKPYIRLYVETAEGAVLDGAMKNAIKKKISSSVMRYAVPREIVETDSLKLTPLGKVDYTYYEALAAENKSEI